MLIISVALVNSQSIPVLHDDKAVMVSKLLQFHTDTSCEVRHNVNVRFQDADVWSQCVCQLEGTIIAVNG